jgi:rhamnogalacturonyl hydrolase YesR
MEKALCEQLSLVENSVARLDNWITRNGWAGYDPYDLKQHPILMISKPKSIGRALRAGFLVLDILFPIILRRVLGIPREVNAKAMGLFSAGYQILYEATGEERYLNKAEEALTWLEENPSQGYAGLCWGQPFAWQSRVYIPENTPSSVVSAIAGDAFWRFYRMTDQDSYLDKCRSICEVFLSDLNIDEFQNGGICFSKTTVDRFHTHNGNLFVADFLLRVGRALHRKDYIETAWKAVAYTLSEQNDDGSLCYWGRDQADQCIIDHYHSGFEIRCLYSIWKTTDDMNVYEALRKYYRFYCEKLFTSSGIPKIRPNSLYPVNIHACAEAILCQSILAPDFPEAQVYLQKCVPWIVNTMQHPDGWFIYMIRKLGWLRWKQKIPYIRWGQAWMLRALAQYYLWIKT